MVYGHGVNDMPKGWSSKKNTWNYLVYRKWRSMLERCYSEKFQEKHPTYKECHVCERWLLLSNFVEDFKKIDGYNEEKFLNGELQLDKDIKSNGKNKEYSLDNCILISKSENARQANKTRDNTYLHGRHGENHPMYGRCGENHPMYGRCGENHPNSIKIRQEDKEGNLIKIWNGSGEAERETGINHGNIIQCCKWYACGENKEEWFKIYKYYPVKSAGGYIWKYLEKED